MDQRLRYLLQRHLSATATAVEQQELTNLLQTDTNRELFSTVLASLMQEEQPAAPANTATWRNMVQQIVAIDKPSTAPVKPIRSSTNLLYRWAAAAAVIVLIGAAVLQFNKQAKQRDEAAAKVALQKYLSLPVAKTTLLLPDGKAIFLDELENGPIATFGHTTISKQNNRILYESTEGYDATQFNMIATARGSTYEVVLTDGSHVWLNAASTVSFPTVFNNNQRHIYLSGEAWFDVGHADKIPFNVSSGSLHTTVLGTAFDIKDYPGDQHKFVAVQRGKVRVTSDRKTPVMLEKGQQVQLTGDATWVQQPIDAVLVGSWKKGELIYRDETLQTIVTDLQRAFNESIIIKNPALKGEKATGTFSKSIGLQSSLGILCNITDSRLSRKDNVYIIE